jgi:hypothetical protein
MFLQTTKRMNAYWIGHVLCRNYLLQHGIEGKIGGGIEVTGRQGRRCKQILNDFKKIREYWKLKEDALDRAQLALENG